MLLGSACGPIAHHQHSLNFQAKNDADSPLPAALAIATGVTRNDNTFNNLSVSPSAPTDNSAQRNSIDAVATGFQSIMHDAEPQFRSIMQTTFGKLYFSVVCDILLV